MIGIDGLAVWSVYLLIVLFTAWYVQKFNAEAGVHAHAIKQDEGMSFWTSLVEVLCHCHANLACGFHEHRGCAIADQTRVSKDAESASSDHSFQDQTPAKLSSDSSQQLVPRKWNWKPGEMLGKGAYGCVYLAILDTGGFAAVKQVAHPTLFR